MGQLEFRPRLVRSWGHAARDTGQDVRSAKSTVGTASEHASSAHLTGLAAGGASQRFTSGVESTISTLAGALTGTGDQLLSTVTVVTSTDDASANLFRLPRSPSAHKPLPGGVVP